MLKKSYKIFLITALAVALTGAVFALPPSKGRWMQIDSRNYTLLTNRPGRGAQNAFLQDLEEARENFITYLPGLTARSTAKGRVRIYRTREQYLEAAGADFKWSGGMWNGRELLISPPENEKNARGARLIIRRVIFHEGFHQYLASVMPGIYVDMWFNEGCAQFFENTDARNRVRLNDALTETLAGTVGSYKLPVKSLMALSYKEFYAPESRNANYQAALALVYYLLKAARAERLPAAGLPDFYITQLKKLRNHKAAFAATARKFDLDAIDKDWRHFWSDPRRQRRAARYIPR